MKTKMAIGSLAVVGMLGCGESMSLIQLKNQASVDLSCPKEQVNRKELGFYFERVEGCGKTMVYYYNQREEKWTSPLERATFEMSCPREQIQTTLISDNTVGVSGCDHKGVYVLNPYTGWVLNSTSDTKSK